MNNLPEERFIFLLILAGFSYGYLDPHMGEECHGSGGMWQERDTSSMAAKKELETSDLLKPDRFLLLKLLEPP